jgi:hypothetical protein
MVCVRLSPASLQLRQPNANESTRRFSTEMNGNLSPEMRRTGVQNCVQFLSSWVDSNGPAKIKPPQPVFPAAAVLMIMLCPLD